RLAQLTRNASITQGTFSIYSHFAGNLMNHLGKIENAIIAPITIGFTFLGRSFESKYRKMEAQYEYYGKRFDGLNQIHLLRPIELDIHTYEGLLPEDVLNAIIAWFSSQEMAAITATSIFNFTRRNGTWFSEDLVVNGIRFKATIGTENNSWFHRLSIGDKQIAQAIIEFPARKEDDSSIVLGFLKHAGEIAKLLEDHIQLHRLQS
ncbi:MAG: hypothetical protein WCV91_04100, partial [Candidatus Margulisiibacteriota bacterium]